MGFFFALLLFLAGVIPASAQQYTITTVAGGSPIPTPVPALKISIGVQSGSGGPAVAADEAGNVYFTSYNCVFKVDASGIATRIAGTSRRAFSGDGGPATSAALNDPRGLAIDRHGNVFIADHGNWRIRKIAANGVIRTVAGNGVSGYSGDGGLALSAQLGYVEHVAVDNADNLYIIDSASSGPNHRVRKVSAEGKISTVAGNGAAGFSGDGGPARSAQFDKPSAIAVDAARNLFISDFLNQRIRKVSPTGEISTLAGKGAPGFYRDGEATSADVHYAHSLALDGAGNLFFTDEGSHRVRKVSAKGFITTVAGDGTTFGYSGEGGPAALAQIFPNAVAVDASGNIYVAAQQQNRVWKVSSAGVITAFAGNGQQGFGGDGGPANEAKLSGLSSVAVDAASRLILADTANSRVRRVDRDGTIHTIAGNGSIPGRPVPGVAPVSGDGGPAASAQIGFPLSAAADREGNMYVGENFRVRKVSPDGTISTVAGTGIGGFSGDGGPATKAQFFNPSGLAVDAAGNVFLADGLSSTVRKVDRTGTISSVAGVGSSNGASRGFSGDGGPAIEARFSGPHGVAVDAQGNLYISDRNNHRVRKVTANGIVSTIAGTGVEGYSGDGGAATQAQLAYPEGLAVDAAGNVYIADSMNNAVRKLQLVR